MQPDYLDSVLDLLPAQVLRLHAAAGVTINCDGGILWVTQEGYARDDFLSPGESLRVACGGVTLVEAVGGTAAKLTLRSRYDSDRSVNAFSDGMAF